MIFTPYDVPLASAALEGSLIGLGCFAVLLVMLFLGRRVVEFFERRDDEDDFSEDVHAAEVPRGDGEGRRRTEGFMVGSGASPADVESC